MAEPNTEHWYGQSQNDQHARQRGNQRVTGQSMDSAIEQLVNQLHKRPGQLVLVTAGAGTYALAWLLGVAGASRTLLEAVVPYAARAFDEFLGQAPSQHVAESTARMLAGRALTRARWLRDPQEWVVGVACTATIVTDRPKRGPHRAHLAVWSQERVASYHLNLHKGARDRAGEEELVSRALLNIIAEAFGLTERLPLSLTAEDSLTSNIHDLTEVVQRLQTGKIPYFGVQAEGYLRAQEAWPRVVLSGSFNPLHEGHLRLAHAAAAWLRQPVAFELAAVNVDKPPVPPDVVLDRLAQFAGRWPVFATRAPTFLEKARLFPGATFVVGYDTAVRIVQPRYYQDNPEHMLAALAEIRDRCCRFLVAGRVDPTGQYRDAAQLSIPADFADLFSALPDFRMDISSTQLREQGARGSR